MAITVRLATLDEARLVRRIMRSAFAEYRGLLHVASGAHAETVRDVADVMQRGGAVLAFDGARAVGSARFEVQPDALYVGRVAVLQSARRRGVASAMMRFVEGQAAHHARTAVRVAVRESLPGNIGLYESLGYERVRLDPHPRGADRVWTMVKHL